MKRYLLVSLVVLLAVSFLLSACGSPSPTATQAPTTSAPTTSAPATTPAATSKPATSAPATSAPTTQAKEKVLRFTISVPPGDPATVAMDNWAKDFNAKFAGRYKMEPIPGGVLAGTSDTMQVVMTGACEIGNISVTTNGAQDARFSVTEVPFLFNNLDAAIEFSKLVKDDRTKIYETKFNQHLLSDYNIGFRIMTSVKKQVKTLEDMKGLLIGVTGPTMSSTMKALGGSPVMEDWTQDLQSLQKGVIDASVAGIPHALVMNKYADVIKYAVNAPFSSSEIVNTINLDIWKSLPADVQAALTAGGTTMEDYCNTAFKAGWNDDFKALSAAGVTVFVPGAAELARWAQAVSPVTDAYWKTIPADAAANYKDLAAKANAKYPVNP
jgi:TRAP-type C4-dicarboxylate transport system substrate-binding protein